MIIRANRFHGHASIRTIYKKGSHIGGKLYATKYYARTNNRPYRLAVVVSKKVHKSAVVRNRIRRRVYEAVRTSSQAPVQDVDIILTVYSEKMATMPSLELQGCINDTLTKIQLNKIAK